jgi:Ras-related protein Rab-7A
MFDVNQPQTLEALRKWWAEFRDRAPIHDEDVDRFCCVFVGNKVDVPLQSGNVFSALSTHGFDARVQKEQALQFMHELIPQPAVASTLPTGGQASSQDLLSGESSAVTFSIFTSAPPRTHSIDIGVYHHLRRKSPRSRSRSTLFRGSTVGTMTTTHTLSAYHTPSSSIFDTFESARSSPARHSRLSTPSHSRSPSQSPIRSARRQPSFSSTVSDTQTITPGIYGRSSGGMVRSISEPAPHTLPIPPPPELGAKLFFTSAKTGDGVSDVFEYVAQRVVRRWEYEEAMEARTLHMADVSESTIRLHYPANESRLWHTSSCCTS